MARKRRRSQRFNIPIKKIWHQTVSLLREECPRTGIGTLTGLFGYSRQSFYNGLKDNEFAENAIEPLIVEKAKDYRKDNPGLGCAEALPHHAWYCRERRDHHLPRL